jgi:hypothetical protein
MSTQPFQEVISHREATLQLELPSATEGALRYVGQSRFGDMPLRRSMATHTSTASSYVPHFQSKRARSDTRDRVYGSG